MDFANYTRFIDKAFSSSLGMGAQATDILVALTIIAVFAILAKLSSYLLQEILPRFTAKTKTTLDDELVLALQRPVQLLVLLTGFALGCTHLRT